MSVDEQPNEDIRRRVARASHELGNLLGVVLNYSTLLERQLTGPALLADVSQIRLAAERATDVVRTLAAAAGDGDERGTR